MKIEFDTVRTNPFELEERQSMFEISPSSVPRYNSEDYLSQVVYDMSLVIGWEVLYVWFNDVRMECVIPHFEDSYGRNLLMSGKDFKKLYGEVIKSDVISYRDL